MQQEKSIDLQIITHKKQKTAQIVIVCVLVYNIQLLIDRGWSDHVNNIKYSTNYNI